MEVSLVTIAIKSRTGCVLRVPGYGLLLVNNGDILWIAQGTTVDRARHARRANWALISKRECGCGRRGVSSASGVESSRIVRLCRTRSWLSLLPSPSLLTLACFGCRLGSVPRYSTFPPQRRHSSSYCLVDTSCRWLFLVSSADRVGDLFLGDPGGSVFSLPFSVSSASARWLDYRSSGAQLLSLFAFYVDQCGYYEPDLPGWSWVFILGRNKSYYLCTYLCVSLYENNHYGSNPSKYVLSFHFFQDNSRIYDCKVFISTFLMISIVMNDDIVGVTLLLTINLFY